MEVLLMVALGLGGLLLLILLMTNCFFRTYADSREGSKLVSCSGTLALTVSLLCLLLIPLDIFIVSYELNGDGSHEDLAMLNRATSVMSYIYFGLYGLMLFSAFFLLPFAYFFYEEEEEDQKVSTQACGALKYSLIFVIIFVVLLVCGIVLIQNKGYPSDDWKGDLLKNFTKGSGIIYFSIGTCVLFGLLAWVCYTGYGLAAFPIALMRGNQSSMDSGELLSTSAQGEMEGTLMSNRQKQEWLKAKYDESNPSSWASKDRIQMHKLEREERTLRSTLDKDVRRNGQSASSSRCDCLGACWTILSPFRWVIGITLSLVSLLMVVSIAITVTDKLMHSECKLKCGYALDKTTFPNPIDLVLTESAKVFPVDFVVFGFFAIYTFICSVNGLVALGVRLCGYKLYNIRPSRTMPHALLFGTWLLMFVVLTINIQTMTLSPQYATFGTQFFFPASNHTHPHPNTTHHNGMVLTDTSSSSKTECTMAGYVQHGNQCAMTQIGAFVHTLNLQIPFFGGVIFFANILFIAVYLLSLTCVLVCGRGKERYSSLNQDDDDW